METKQINQLLESIEEHTIQIIETADLMDILCNAQCIDEAGKYLYILTQYLKNECDKLEDDRIKLKIAWHEY